MRWKAAATAGSLAWLVATGAAGAPPKPSSNTVPDSRQQPAAAPASAASATSDALTAGTRDLLDREFKRLVVPRFAIAADEQLDPELRAATEAMQAEHLPRVRQLMERWLLEEFSQPEIRWAFVRMEARLANEFALWGRDSTGSAHDAALARALETPGMCRPSSPNASELVMRLHYLRNLPPDMRRAAVHAERELLARWGQPRPVSDAEPLPAEDMLLQLRATGQQPLKALPMVLAFYFLGDVKSRQRDPFQRDQPARCAMHQWAGANPAEFRAAMALQAADLIGMDRRKAAAPGEDAATPRLAEQFKVGGVVTVQAETNAAGRAVRPKVVRRALQVPGIRDARPFAFEGAMDLAALDRARAAQWPASAGAGKPVEQDFTWSPAQ